MSRIATVRQNLAFGERLAQIRLRIDLSQAEFADSLGLSLRAYANYERGEREAPLAVVRALYDVYNIDPVWLMGGYGKEPFTTALKVDVSLIAEIAYEIDRRLNQACKRLKPTNRRRLIEVAYARCLTQGAVDATYLDGLLAVTN